MTTDNLDNLDSFLDEAATKLNPTGAAPTPAPTTPRRANDVFAAPQAPAPTHGNVQLAKQQENAKKEFGIEIPVDAVPLPSGGRLYPLDHPFHGVDHVEYKAMTAKEEDILMNAAYIKKGTVINELIRSCMIDRRVDVNSLVSGDRNAMMVAIRISGYGREYVTNYNCPRCDHKNELKTDLAELPLKALSVEPLTVGENRFAFKLPTSGNNIVFKFLTGKEEEEAIKQAESRKKRGIQNSQSVTTRLMFSIVAVDGHEDPARIARFVEVMRASDSLALRKFIDEHEPGVEMEVEFTCSACDHNDQIQLPIGSNFFWPGSQR